MSPEAIHGRPADQQSDLWSYGCTAFQLFTGRTPFKGISDYLTFLKADAGSYSLPDHLQSAPEAKLLQQVLQVKSKDRIISGSILKKSDYFKDVDFVSLEDPKQIPRLPIPSLSEICVERLGNAIWIEAEAFSEGPLSYRVSHAKKNCQAKIF